MQGAPANPKSQVSNLKSPAKPSPAELKKLRTEVGHLELHRRALVGTAVVAADAARLVEVLDDVERFVAARPETELLSACRALHSTEDE